MSSTLAATTRIKFGASANESVAVGKTQAQVPVPAIEGNQPSQTEKIWISRRPITYAGVPCATLTTVLRILRRRWVGLAPSQTPAGIAMMELKKTAKKVK